MLKKKKKEERKSHFLFNIQRGKKMGKGKYYIIKAEGEQNCDRE